MWSDISTNVDFDSRLYTSFQVKVYSPNAGTLSISGRNATDGELFNSSTVLAVGTGWTTITQNIVSTQRVKKIVLRFNFGADPAGGPADVVYIDDLKFIKTASTNLTLYAESFFADWSQWGSWTDKPSTQIGKWKGGINIETTGDANMTLERWWDAGEHRLKITPTDAAVTIPNINVTGFTNLAVSLDPTASPNIEASADGGAWSPLTIVGGISALPSATSTISIRINPAAADTVIDYLNVTGEVVSLGTNSNQLSGNSIKVYPNPFVNEFNVAKSEGSLQVSVYDVLGRKVETAKSSSSQLSMGSSLKSGVYVVKVEGANEKDSKSFKIIKK
jgi:hypothetical protein